MTYTDGIKGYKSGDIEYMIQYMHITNCYPTMHKYKPFGDSYRYGHSPQTPAPPPQSWGYNLLPLTHVPDSNTLVFRVTKDEFLSWME